MTDFASQDPYPLPRATGERAAETERLDGQHEMFKLALGTITTAPLPVNLSSVLDLGCGTGIWSCEFAESHSSAQILGIDIVPPTAPPSGRLVPGNCKFIQGNIEEDWDFAKSMSFDFIFARLLVSSTKDWPGLFTRIYQHLRPGGIFESYDGILALRADDGTTVEDSAMMRWYEVIRDFVHTRGGHPDGPLSFTPILESNGFKVVQDRWIKVYLDPDVAVKASQTDNAAQVATMITSALRSMVTHMTEKVLTSDAHRRLAAEALDDLAQNSGRRGYHSLHMNRIVQKPA